MPKAIKVDLYKKHHTEYVTPKEPVFVTIGPAKYLTIPGQGSPKGEKFESAVSALYSVAFTLKRSEKAAGHDYKVCHLEGQWWTDGGSDWQMTKPEEWHWRLLIRVPEFVSEKEVWVAIKTLWRKAKAELWSTRSSWRPWKKAVACKFCTSGRIPPRRRRWTR